MDDREEKRGEERRGEIQVDDREERRGGNKMVTIHQKVLKNT